jgi:putative ABC transport system ATP-binding protein
MSNPSSNHLALSAKNLTKTYELGGETIYALQDVNFEVKRGEYVAVMGPSGSGKSTLMHLLGLLDLPDKGEVLVEGKSTKDLDDDELTYLRRDKLGFVFQTFELIPTLTAKENILLPAEVAGQRNEAEKRCEKIAAQLGIRERLNHRPNQLSGGQRQRVAIARSLINDPVVILADEPTGNLDSQTSTEVLELLKRGVKENNWTVIMVTHDPKAAMYADRIVFLEDGKLSGESRTDATQIHKIIEQFVGV